MKNLSQVKKNLSQYKIHTQVKKNLSQLDSLKNNFKFALKFTFDDGDFHTETCWSLLMSIVMQIKFFKTI
jgi:hypothetical protein